MVITRLDNRRWRRDAPGPFGNRTLGITGPFGTHGCQVFAQTIDLVRFGACNCLPMPMARPMQMKVYIL